MYNVWNSIDPEDVKEVIAHAGRQRFSQLSEKVQDDSIIITQEWREQLKSMPFISKQKGRMSHLLKKKAKIVTVRKERKTYDALDI